MLHLKLIAGLSVATLMVACSGDPPSPEGVSTTAAEQSPVDPPAAEWWQDFLQAVRVAQKENRPILMNFTGSDWSPPCERWKEGILSTPEFADYAAAHLILLEVDFPKFKEQVPEVVQQNQVLQAAFGVEAFPTLILLQPDGQEIERMSGVLPQGPREFIAWLRQESGRAG